MRETTVLHRDLSGGLSPVRGSQVWCSPPGVPPLGRGGGVLPCHWAVARGNANEAPGAGRELAEPSGRRGSARGRLTGRGRGECHRLCGTRARGINIDVAVGRTILGLGGTPGATGGCERGSGIPAGGEGEVPRLRARADTGRAGRCHPRGAGAPAGGDPPAAPGPAHAQPAPSQTRVRPAGPRRRPDSLGPAAGERGERGRTRRGAEGKLRHGAAERHCGRTTEGREGGRSCV